MKSLNTLSYQTLGDFVPRSVVTAKKKALHRDDEDEDGEPSGGDVATESLGGYAIARFSGALEPARPVDYSLPVDVLNDEIIIELGSAGPTLPTLSLRDPAGAPIDLKNPPAHVTVQETGTMLQVRITKPAAGNWSARVQSGIDTAFTLDLSGFGERMGETESPYPSLVYPQAAELMVKVENGLAVTGCQVRAVVIHPDGTKVTVPLYDDGNRALHCDERAGDGTYSAYFARYPASGTYRVQFMVDCQKGQYTTAFDGIDLDENSDVPGPTGPAPVFQRIFFDSFTIEGVPAAGGTAILAPGNLVLEGTALSQFTLLWTDTSGGSARTVIQRSLGEPDQFQEIAVVDAGQAHYVDNGAGMGGSVFYRLLSRNDAGDSNPGDPRSMEASMVALMMGGYSDGGMVFGGDGGSGNKGFCFIATAAYGSPLDPHVEVLRLFRDRFLLTSRPGQFLVNAYYTLSPPLARAIAPSPLLRAGTRHMLTPFILTVAYPLPALIILCSGIFLAVVLRRRWAMKPILQGGRGR
jgi:hypothetical protein